LLALGIGVLAACSGGETIDLSADENSSTSVSPTPDSETPDNDNADEQSGSWQPSDVESVPNESACQTLDEVLDGWEEGREMVAVLEGLEDRSENAADAARDGRFKPAARTITQYQTVGAGLSLDPPDVPLDSAGDFDELLKQCEDNPSRQRGLWAQGLLSEVELLAEFFSNEEMYEFPYNPGRGIPRIQAYGLANFLEANRNGVASEIGFEETLPRDFENISRALGSAIKKGQSVFTQ